MNDSQKLLNQLVGSSGGSSATSALNGLQSEMALLFWIGLVGTIVITIIFVVYLVFKMRVQSAILRIDKNLQRLVEAQVPAAETDSEDIEQK